MSRLCPNQPCEPPVAVNAQGLLLRDSLGRTYIDAGAGAALASLGHGHPEVLSAMHRQIDRIAYAPAGVFSTEVAGELAARLLHGAPAGIGAACFVADGAAAIDSALRMARRYMVDTGQRQRTLCITRRPGGHADPAGAPAPADGWPRSVAPCHEYRDRRADESVEYYTATLLAELEAAIIECGADRVAAFVAEPVAGATPPTPGYFRGVRDICDRYGVLFIADETACGMGRTGTMYALEQEGAAPDLIALANGLAGGYQPLGAVLAQVRISERLAGGGAFGHGQGGHPVACAAALAVHKVIERDALLAQVRRRGEALRRMLRSALGDHPHVGDIRGRGLLMGLELVKERATKTPFDPARRLHAAVGEQALARGLLLATGAGDGRCGDQVLLAPPFIASEADLAEIVSRLADAIGAALG